MIALTSTFSVRWPRLVSRIKNNGSIVIINASITHFKTGSPYLIINLIFSESTGERAPGGVHQQDDAEGRAAQHNKGGADRQEAADSRGTPKGGQPSVG